MDDYRESEASRRASGWTYAPDPPDPPNPEAAGVSELHTILFDAPPPAGEDPEKTKWRIMTMLKGLKAAQNEEALAALQQIAALSTSNAQAPAAPITQSQAVAATPPPPMAGRLGQVLSWIANTISIVVLVGGGLFVIAADSRPPDVHDPPAEFVAVAVLILAAAAGIWGVGRAMRYVLTGPRH